jgi:Clostripain family
MSRMPGTGTVDVATETEIKTPQKPETREWTIMFYFASDNSLASTIVGQLKALKDARFHPDVNVVAHFDPHVVNTPSQVFDINLVEKLCPIPEGEKKEFRHQDPFVPNLALDKLPNQDEETIRKIITDHVVGLQAARNSPEPRLKYDPAIPGADLIGEVSPAKSLQAFLDFCGEHYPARHYMLVILGHGEIIGNQTFLSDDVTDSQHFMSLKELGEIVGSFPGKAGGKLEMIGFHSCSMSSVEVAFELAGKAKYMLASQGPAYVGSWPYRSLLIRLFNDDAGKNFDDAAVKRMFLKMFKYCFFNNQDFQMAGYAFDISMVNLDNIGVAKDAISKLAQELGSALSSSGNPRIVKDLIRLAHLDAQSFSGESYTDLYDFCWCLEWLCSESPSATVLNGIKAACNQTRKALRSYRDHDPDSDKTFVVSSAFIGAAVQYTHGLSVLFPWTAPLDPDWKKKYADSRFSKDTKWDDFLQTYFNATMRETRAEEFKHFPDKRDQQDQSLGTILIKLMMEGSNNGNGNGHSSTGTVFGKLGQLPAPGPENTLGKRGPDDPMGKRGPDDPTGLSCDCGTIKNYPRNT